MSPTIESIELIYHTILAELAQRCESEEALGLIPGSPQPDEQALESRRKLVDILCREGGLPKLPQAAGALIARLVDKGVFRRGGVLLEGPMREAYAAYFGVISPPVSSGAVDKASRETDFAQVIGVGIFKDSWPSYREPQEKDKHLGGRDVTFVRLRQVPGENDIEIRAVPSVSDMHIYQIEEAVTSVWLHDAGSLIRLPAPERRFVALLVDLEGDSRVAEFDWVLEATRVTRLQVNAVAALKDALVRHPTWKRDMQRSLRNLSADLRKKFVDLCETGEKLRNGGRSILDLLEIDMP